MVSTDGGDLRWRPMHIDAIRFRLTEGGDGPLEARAWRGSVGNLSTSNSPAVYVVPSNALAALRERSNVFNDRGQKHPSRQLSALLLRQPLVPIVNTAYASARQLPRSIKDVLRHALGIGERKVYVLGVPRRVFEQCAAKVAPVDTLSAEGDSADNLEDLLDDVEVPPALELSVVGESPEMHLIRKWIVRTSRHQDPVLILGDTGTGKGVIAKAVHDLQFGHKKPFVTMNCGAIPTDLFEKEFFGAVRGAFTGAHDSSLGVWRQASDGTLFLDEIGELSLFHQVKLLRAIEAKKVRPVGSDVEIKVDARLIAATNRDLGEMMETGEFREELYYRVGLAVLTVPKLQDRPDDIAPLANAFWRTLAPKREPLSEEFLRELKRYRWPGNARQLRSVIAYINSMFPKAVPTATHVRAVMRINGPRQAGGDSSLTDLERMERVHHLRRTRTAIDTCQRMVRTLGSRALDNRARLATVVSGVLTELQLVAARPALFTKTGTFEAAQSVVVSLEAFQSLLEREAPEAMRYGRRELKERAAAAWRIVKREEDRLRKDL